MLNNRQYGHLFNYLYIVANCSKELKNKKDNKCGIKSKIDRLFIYDWLLLGDKMAAVIGLAS